MLGIVLARDVQLAFISVRRVIARLKIVNEIVPSTVSAGAVDPSSAVDVSILLLGHV